MSDVDRMFRLLRERGQRGVHTHELRTMGYSGNPSQRAADIEAKYGVEIQRDRESRNGRPGSRYTLESSAGVGAEDKQTEGVCVDGERVPGLCRTASQLKSSRVDSGRGSTGDRGQPAEHTSAPACEQAVDKAPGAPARSVPSMFDADDCLDWGDAA